MAGVYGNTRATIVSVDGKPYTGKGLSEFSIGGIYNIGQAYELIDGTLYKQLVRRRRKFNVEWYCVTNDELNVIMNFFPSLKISNKLVDNNNYNIGYYEFGSTTMAYSDVYIGDSVSIRILTAWGTPESRLYSVKFQLIERN